MGVDFLRSACSRDEKPTIRSLSFRIPDSRPASTDVDQRFCVHGHGTHDLLLHPQPADHRHQRDQDRQDLRLARYHFLPDASWRRRHDPTRWITQLHHDGDTYLHGRDRIPRILHLRLHFHRGPLSPNHARALTITIALCSIPRLLR